ncbi:hypothetical protein [Methylobacter sp. YRD-M1]|jgi:hypothetical protein|nr:hypothetical protein [Methylobacter sp. YRD-M1]
MKSTTRIIIFAQVSVLAGLQLLSAQAQADTLSVTYAIAIMEK